MVERRIGRRMWTKISRNPVVGYTGRRGPCHKYWLAGAKSSPVDSRGRFSLLLLSIWYSISLRASNTWVGPVLEQAALHYQCVVSLGPLGVFMCFGCDSQGAWLAHSVYWFTQQSPLIYAGGEDQDWAEEYFTAKYLTATPDLCALALPDSTIGFQKYFLLFLSSSSCGSAAGSCKYCGHD